MNILESTAQNIMFLLFKGYRLITNNSKCIVALGSSEYVPSRCFKIIYTISDCEEACTSSAWCPGYFISHNYGYGHTSCFLLVSSQSYTTCPNGFELHKFSRAWTVVYSSNDLVADHFTKEGISCYAKNQGTYN